MSGYMWEMERLIYEGKEEEAWATLGEGMQTIGREVREMVNRHPGDWPLVIEVMKMMAEGMENILSPKEKMRLAFISTIFDAEMRGSTTKVTVDADELKKQMEGEQ